MTTSTPAIDTNLDKRVSEQNWNALYPVLLPLAKRWVYGAHLLSWHGQENDIAWDIVQVAIQRAYESDLKEQSKNTPIRSYRRLSIRIANNYFKDLIRKDSRLQSFNREGFSQLEYTLHDEKNDTEVILDKVYEEWLFQVIAKKIASFSTKLRRAMLIDLARFIDFEAEPSPLQAAFSKVGIQLEEYAGLFPQEPILRSRHSSLVSLGYRHLRLLFRNCECCDFAIAAIGA
jgi:DNA-directed RNA polymerase specialized sigma24 family protein